MSDQIQSIIIGVIIGLASSLITVFVSTLLGFWKDSRDRKYQEEKDFLNRRRAKKESRLRELEEYLKNSFKAISEFALVDGSKNGASQLVISKHKIIGIIFTVYNLGIVEEYGDDELDSAIKELMSKLEQSLSIIIELETAEKPKTDLGEILLGLMKIYGKILKKIDVLSTCDTKLPGITVTNGK